MNRLLLFSVWLFYLCSQCSGNESVTLTLLYQPTCPYCRDFIAHQMSPNWREFNESLKIDIIPFIDNSTLRLFENYPDQEVIFIQPMCAIYEACGDQGTMDCPITKLSKAVQFLSCTMTAKHPTKVARKCAKEAKLDHLFSLCAKKEVKSRLLKYYYDKSAYWNNIYPSSTVPVIFLDKKHTEEMQDEAQKNLRKLLCQKYIKC